MADNLLDRCVRFGPFVLDRADERLTADNRPVSIGNKAFRVLDALVAQNGRLLTKDSLFETVWDGMAVSESALTSVIKELRRALGDDAQEPRYIQSVYGRGYRFIAEIGPLATGAVDRVEPPAVGPSSRGDPPTLVVLPFANRSGLPQDDVFAQGMVEDVIAALSQGVNLVVLGSTVTASLRGAPIPDLAALGRRLGVQYLLEGSVRRSGRQLRVTVQILEAATGAVRWSTRFERSLDELAVLQEDLVTELAANLNVQVEGLELQRILRKPHDLTAWEALMRSTAMYNRLDPRSLRGAILEAERAVAIAPDYAAAHAQIALAAAVEYLLTSPADPDTEARIARLVERALELDHDDVLVLSSIGCALNYTGRPGEAVPHLARAVAKAPGHGMSRYHLGVSHCLLGRPDEAIRELDAAILLFSGSPLLYLVMAWRAGAHLLAGRWREGEGGFDDVLAQNPAFLLGRVQKAVCQHRRGEAAAARDAVNALRANPHYDHAQSEILLRRIFGETALGDEMVTTARALWQMASAAPARATVE